MKDLACMTATEEDFRLCRAYTRHYAKTFYFASHVLPREKRDAAYALYAFCRRADEVADDAGAIRDPGSASRRLALLRDDLSGVYSKGEMRDPKLNAFQATVTKYRIPQQYFSDLLRGIEMDITKRRYRNFEELQDYCYCVASTVGLMMTKVLGAINEEAALQRAADMGTAMQLTNILRDVGEDYQRGRVYLPADEMERFCVREEDFAQRVPAPGFVNLMKFQIERARSFYNRASAGIPLLTNDGSRFCVRLMSRTYAQILPDIAAHGYDSLSRRAYVPLYRKTRIALKALFWNEHQTTRVCGGEQSVSRFPPEQRGEPTHAT